VFGWFKKNDGFIWHDYVRTTILVRRDQRREKLALVRDVAVEGVKHAGKQGAALTVAGARAAALGAVRSLALTYYWLSDALIAGTSATWLWLSDRVNRSTWVAAGLETWTKVWRRWSDTAIEPAYMTPALLVGGICGLSATLRIRDHGIDPEALITGTLAGAALLYVVLPRLSAALAGHVSWSQLGATLWPRSFSPDLGYALKLVSLLGLGFAALAWLVPALTSGAAPVPDATGTQTGNRRVLMPASGVIEGKPAVIAGDQMRLSGTLVRLFGVEAPEVGQTCSFTGKKQESCGLAAKAALQKLVAGKPVRCEVSTRQSETVAVASCTVGGADIAGQLVRGGYVFAQSGLFATYASAEREATSARAGLWRSGAARPTDYRAKVWDEAKDQAPDGCPIKAVVNGESKTYLVPWAANYERTKIKASRGERWFCTEAEARAAGWKPADPG